MAGGDGGATITGVEQLRSKLAARAQRMRNLAPVMRVIGEELIRVGHDAFQQRRSPAGEAWAKLAESTLRARAAKVPGASRRSKATGALTAGAKRKREAAVVNPAAIAPLIDTGSLRASMRYRADARGLTWSVLRYGPPHMDGAKNGRPPKRNFAPFELVAGKRVLIPALGDFANRAIRRFIFSGAL